MDTKGAESGIKAQGACNGPAKFTGIHSTPGKQLVSPVSSGGSCILTDRGVHTWRVPRVGVRERTWKKQYGPQGRIPYEIKVMRVGAAGARPGQPCV